MEFKTNHIKVKVRCTCLVKAVGLEGECKFWSLENSTRLKVFQIVRKTHVIARS